MGRPKGSPNRATADVRAAMARFAEWGAPKFAEWVEQIAKGGDQAKAADLYLRAIEYHIPKLARTEVSGPDGGPVQHAVDVSGLSPEELRVLAKAKISGES